MKKVLIITYYWPPGSGPGVQRFLKFCKYLREFGWEPVVLTLENGSYPSMDESLLNEIPENMQVYRSKAFEPFKWYNLLKGKKANSVTVGTIGLEGKSFFQKLSMYIRANFFIPDARKGWNKSAIKKAKQIIKDHELDAMISTGPPHSSHLIAHELKNLYKLPWIADLRDPWTTVFYNEFFPRTDKTKIKDKALEDLVIKSADSVSVVSNGMLNEFSERAKDICLIYNGFDEADFVRSQKSKNQKFTISYIGNFKPNQNALSIWESLQDLALKYPEFISDLCISLTGNVDKSIIASVQNYGLGEQLIVDGFAAHKVAVQKMMSSDLLLFIIPVSERNHLIITGKLFEYLATGNSILAVGPVQGDASALIKDAGRDVMLDYQNKDSILSQIEKEYLKWKSGENSQLDNIDLNRFTRKGLSEKLANKLNEISS